MQHQVQYYTPTEDTTNNTALIDQITLLVNTVYSDAESGMWKPGVDRTNAKNIKYLLSKKSLFCAQKDNNIVGVIYISPFDKNTYEFGMLAVKKSYRNLGIGLTLIKHAEEFARYNGAKEMRLELLTPKTWEHPSKEFLKEWYRQLSYQFVHTAKFSDIYPNLAVHLSTECNFCIYQKDLTVNN